VGLVVKHAIVQLDLTREQDEQRPRRSDHPASPT